MSERDHSSLTVNYAENDPECLREPFEVVHNHPVPCEDREFVVSKSSTGSEGRGKPDPMEAFASYASSLSETFVSEKTEHTDRDAIKRLLQQISPTGLTIVHEPKRVPGSGAPDFKIRQNGQIVGYVETKPVGTKLSELKRVLKTDQLERYQSLSSNIILTDYLNWIWIHNGNIQSGSLGDVNSLASRKFRPKVGDIEQISALLRGFLSVPPTKISRANNLADELALRSRLLRDFLKEELERQEREGQQERLFGLYSAFKQQISESITLPDFADAFAQTLAYGLFLSKLNANGYSLSLGNAKQYIPKAFKLIQELVGFIDVLDADYYKDVKWVVDEILSIINGLNVASIKEDLSFRNRKGSYQRSFRAVDEEEWRLFSRDPFIYFYEDFLAKYDADLKKSRGVYYTPPPVVNYIVRAVDDVLKKEFEIKAGLADQGKVTVLDFACGTGTFIVEVIERIIDNLGASTGKIDLVLRDHVLKNIFAFEYLIAPYTIAHLKLSQYFEDRQIRVDEAQRFNIFLTNTLEPFQPQQNFLVPALSEEAKRAIDVKKQPILVITGNPPYAGNSKNKGDWITEAVEEYKFVRERAAVGGGLERKSIGEKNPKWLQDDYVKFIRFAQLKMDAVDEGVVCIITNHSYLSNPTFRGMRQSLMQTFDQIWLFDLHGSSKPKETPPDGLADENVFDIMKGVAISLFVKKRNAERGVWHADLWGSRLDKYKALAHATKDAVSWTKIEPISPHYLFVPQDTELLAEYNSGISVSEIFPAKVLGFQTHRDHFAISFSKKEMEARIKDLADPQISIDAIKNKYDLKDNRDWSVKFARGKVIDTSWKSRLLQCDYRPFDRRWCLFGQEMMDYPRRELMDHVASRENISLIVPRQIGTAIWRHAFVAANPSNDCLISDRSREAGQVFPLYLYPKEEGKKRSKDLFKEKSDRIENIDPKFRLWLRKQYERDIDGETILGYVYAVLYSNNYRSRYVNFLRRDFPRIQFPKKLSDFERLAELGRSLMSLHLMRDLQPNKSLAFKGKGNYEVEKIEYSVADEVLSINEGQSFASISQQIWNLEIGGFRPLEKFLKSRKGRKLSLEEIDGVLEIVSVLGQTINQVKLIDKAFDRAFPV